MVLLMGLRVICVAIVFLLLLVFAQDIQPRAMPEPTRTYTCDETYHPTDMTFNDETLYSVSTFNELLLEFPYGGPGSENLERNEDIEPKPEAVLRHEDATTCIQVTSYLPSRPFSIVLTSNNALCTNYHGVGTTGAGGFFPFVNINCFRNSQSALTLFENSVGNGNGLVATPEGLWIAHWQSVSVGDGTSKIVGRITLLSYQSLEDSFEPDRPKQPKSVKPVKEFLIDSVPYFIDANPQDNTLFVTTFTLPRNKEQYSEKLLRIDQDGNISTFKDGFQLPSGVLVLGNELWVADSATGELFRLALTDGSVLSHFTGLQGPMGIAQSPKGDLCIAEMRAARISCYSLASLGLE
jgi:hypothetical protein